MRSIKESIIGRRGITTRQYFIIWPAIRDVDLLYSRFPDRVEYDTNSYKWFLLSYEELRTIFNELEWVYGKKGNSVTHTDIYKVEDPPIFYGRFQKRHIQQGLYSHFTFKTHSRDNS